MMRALLLTLAASLIGCVYYEERLPAAQPEQITASVSYTIHGDAECLPAVRADIESAAREWGTVSHGHIAYRFVWDLAPATIFELGDKPLLICRSARWSTEFCGMTTGTIVEVSMSPRCNVHGTSLHEFGHLAGIHDHVDDSRAVMHVSSDVRRLTISDVRACADQTGLCSRPGRKEDVTTMTVTIDPNIPRIEPEYPR